MKKGKAKVSDKKIGAKVSDKKRIDSKGFRIIAVVLFLVVVLVFLQIFLLESGTGTIERSFDKEKVSPGEKVEVSLDIRLGEGQEYYILEESVPEGFVVLGDVANGNKIRLVEIQNAKSNVFTYTVEAPAETGTYVFSGEYGMKFINGSRIIEGDDTIIVE